MTFKLCHNTQETSCIVHFRSHRPPMHVYMDGTTLMWDEVANCFTRHFSMTDSKLINVINRARAYMLREIQTVR